MVKSLASQRTLLAWYWKVFEWGSGAACTECKVPGGVQSLARLRTLSYVVLEGDGD